MDKAKILIVEDDIDLSHMLSAYFRSQDYEVRAAVFGQEALEISREEEFHLIMLDVRLPDMDGYEVYRHLRHNRRTVDIPIIFLSEKRHRLEMLQGLELGVVDYVAKPFDVQELGLRVRNAIQRATQPALINPVTELPEAPLLDEKLSELIAGKQHWAILILSVVGLDKVREQRGFLAADELMRAIALIVSGVVREQGSENDFVAHYRPEELIVISTTNRMGRIHSLIESRICRSLINPYGREDECDDEARDFNIETFVLDWTRGKCQSVDELKAKLEALIDPPSPAAGKE